MKVIVCANEKGGSTKSSCIEALFYGLRNKGYKVLCCDLDQSGNLTDELIGDNFKLDVSDLLTGKYKPEDIIVDDVIPGGNALVVLPAIIERNEYGLLKRTLKSVESKYDFLLIDTPATTSSITMEAFASSDYVIVPSEPSPAGINSAYNTINVINLVKSKYNSGLNFLGIVLVKFKPNYKVHNDILNLVIKQQVPLFKTTIRESQAINNAKMNNVSFFAKEYKTAKAVIDFHSFVREVLEKVK